ncbi:MAG: CHRD domain-containing protein [Anaerolineae bacterium]|nr:CHRD domain-containing protein [Anaerolineae bacterium]
MRNFTRLLVAALFCGALFSAAFVGAQDATATVTPGGEATLEPTTEMTMEPTTEATMEATSEATSEATMEMTMEATAEPSTGSTTASTAAPTAEATTSSSTTGSTVSANGIVCDSDLILSLYVAEHYFGFDGVISAVTSAGSTTMTPVDLTTLDKGQYAPLFTAPIMAIPTTVMTQDQMQTAASMMTMDDATMMSQMAAMMPSGTDMRSMTTLNTVAIAGEDAACTTLRSELNRFYTILAFQGMQADMMAMTPEATSSVSSDATSSAVNFSTTMTGANETQPADPDGTGTAAITIDMANSQVCYTVAVQNIALPATMAHIHRGAVGVKGAPVVTFDALPDASGTATSCVKTDAALLQEIASNPAGFYVNVHNAEFPDGAVRGQLSG